MKRIGQDVAELLDCTPGSFTVDATSGLLAHVLVAKFLDHLPLYREERILKRAGLLIARSTLADWVGECGAQQQPMVDAPTRELLRQAVLRADQAPVAMLKPGNKKTHKAYIWSYCSTPFSSIQAMVFNFAETRSGENVRRFLGQDAPHSAQANRHRLYVQTRPER